MTFTVEDWYDNIGNTSVGQILLGDGSIPSEVSPTEALFHLVEGFRAAQDEYNDGLTTAGPYMNVMPPMAVNSVVFFDDQGNPYQQIVGQFNFRKMYTSSGYNPPTNNVAI